MYTGLFRPLSGGQSRYNNLIQQLRKRGHAVIVLEPDEYVDAQDCTLATVYSYKDFKLFGRNFGSFRDFVANYVLKVLEIVRTNRIDLVQVSHPSGASAVKLATVIARKHVPIVYAPHNVESALIAETIIEDRRYERLTSFERGVIPAYFEALERFVAKRVAAGVIAVSDHDREVLINKFSLDPQKVHVVPSGCAAVSLPSGSERADAREKLGIGPEEICVLFHGFYAYGPNREAFKVIQEYIAPRVAVRNDRVIFLLAGTDAPVFERGNVRSVGFVQDLRHVLASADIALVPLTTGSGTKLKVFDYMNYALPIVATRKAMEGIKANDGHEALIAENLDEALISKLLHLSEDVDERRRIGSNARRLLESTYTWDAIGDQLVIAYEHILREWDVERRGRTRGSKGAEI